MDKFSELVHITISLDCRQWNSTLLIRLSCTVSNGLNARQSEIFIKMPLKGSFKLLKSIRCLLKNVKRIRMSGLLLLCTESTLSAFYVVFSLLELFFSCCIVVAVAKENLLKTPAIVFQRTQMLQHPRLAFDWLSVSFFDYWPIRISASYFFALTQPSSAFNYLKTAFIIANQNWINFSCILL